MGTKYSFCVAEHLLQVTFEESARIERRLLPSVAPFRVEEGNDCCLVYMDGNKCLSTSSDMLFCIRVDDNISVVPREERSRIDIFDTGNGKTTVDLKRDGGYQFIIKDIAGHSCCMLQTNNNFTEAQCALNGSLEMRRFGLNNALMMMYAFRGSFFDTLLIHASLVRNNGYGYAFIAQSGTGKSTHTSLWLKHIEGSDLMNDDNPIVRIIDNKPMIYGSPWSGKTPCYRNIKAPLGAITKIDRAKQNSVERLSPTIAFSQILPSCSSMKWDKVVFRNTYDTVIKLIEAIPSVNVLHCLPDEDAARTCYNAIAIK